MYPAAFGRYLRLGFKPEEPLNNVSTRILEQVFNYYNWGLEMQREKTGSIRQSVKRGCFARETAAAAKTIAILRGPVS